MEAHVALAAEKLIQIGPIPITNSLLTTWLVTLLLIGAAYLATRHISEVPRPLQNFAEFLIETFQDLVGTIAGEKTRVFFPIVASFFFFILLGNYFGLLPGVGSVGFYSSSEAHSAKENEEHKTTNYQLPTTNSKVFVPYLRSINSDLNTTAALAIVSLITTHFLAVKYLGLGSYLKKFFSLNPIFLFVGLLELIGEATKILSLSFRLFGNIFAGEVLLATASTRLFAFVVPIPFYFLEILVGFIQALIFAMLTLVFMVILTEKANH